MGTEQKQVICEWEPGNEPLGYLVKCVFFGMRRRIEELLRPHGLTFTQRQALMALRFQNGMTHSELEKVLKIEAPSLTSLVKGMVDKGWIIRCQHPKDARIKQIFLTEKGTETVEKTKSVMEHIEEEVMEGLSGTEMIQIKSLLRRVIGNLS